MGRANSRVPSTGRNHVAAEFFRLFRSIVDPYRPEMHYMRGPGPKWHAKHAAPQAEAPAFRELARIEG